MKQDLVELYQAATLTEAQLLKNRLLNEGIEAFIDNDDSPFDGLTAASQYVLVRVLPKDADQARAVAAEFQAEHTPDTSTQAD